MLDISIHTEGFEEVRYLNIKYRYKFLDYLVADKHGNIFILEHCPDKRTIPFKLLSNYKNGKYKSIKYHKRNISFIHLRKIKLK